MRWPAGVISAGVHCGLKPGGGRDLGLLVAEEPAAWAGTFTKNAAAAECVRWSRSLLGGRLRAIVVNSGNANACTGAAGVRAVQATAHAAAAAVGCGPAEVAVASTGPIGVRLSVEKIAAALPAATAMLGAEVEEFADAIRTTDTVTKTTGAEVAGCRVVGAAKGAAMLAPNMATMLAFLVTDAEVESGTLREVLGRAVAKSFDRICVDACESTNDSVFLLATGAAGEVDPSLFEKAVTEACGDLAEQMVRDAEGASRVMRIVVEGTPDDAGALRLGRAVASSALWRAAVNGADPNWGRVLAALGAADRSLSLDGIELSIGSEVVFAAGEPTGEGRAAAADMEAPDFTVRCVVGRGPGRTEVLSADLSADYVRLNAGGTT